MTTSNRIICTHADLDAAATHIAQHIPEGSVGATAWLWELLKLAHLGLDADRPSLDELADYRSPLAPIDLDQPF